MNSVVIKKSYPKTLEGGFSSLTCFYEQLGSSESDIDFFRIISENIVPLIQQSAQIKPHYEKWIEESEIYEKNWQTEKSKASKILEETYHSIHVKLSQKNLLDEPEISSRIAFIESLIQFKSSFKNFRYFQNFSNQLKILFHQILKLGELSIFQPFAEIPAGSQSTKLESVKADVLAEFSMLFTLESPESPLPLPLNSPMSERDVLSTSSREAPARIAEPFAEIEILEEIPFQNAVGHTNKLLTHSHVFDPVLEELSKLEKITNWKDLTKPWAAFNKLLRAKRAWNNQEQDFKNNSLIEEYIEWKDMKALKDNPPSKYILFFKREKYLNYIEILLNEILVYQDTLRLPAKKAPKAFKDCSIPHSISLDCKYNQLFLCLIGNDNQYSEKIILHKFNEESSPRDFFENLISNGIGNPVDCEDGGGTVSKHILDVKFPNVFRDFFIHKISTHKATLKANPIILNQISKNETDQLFKEIDRLRTKNQKASKKKPKQKRISK